MILHFKKLRLCGGRRARAAEASARRTEQPRKARRDDRSAAKHFPKSITIRELCKIRETIPVISSKVKTETEKNTFMYFDCFWVILFSQSCTNICKTIMTLRCGLYDRTHPDFQKCSWVVNNTTPRSGGATLFFFYYYSILSSR